MRRGTTNNVENYSITDRISVIETNLSNVNKSMLVSTCKVFMDVGNALKQRKGSDMFEIVLKWCRLYMDIQTAIDPKNFKLLEQFEDTASTAITYIIGYLQYKTNRPKDYHYSLLEILDRLLQNLPPNVVKKCDRFETGTIACLWKPIDIVGGDIKTQLLALKIFASLLKCLDEVKRNDELEIINKLTHFNVLKKELNTIVQETPCYSLLENASRGLLNTYNTYVLRNVNGLSFYCNYLTIGNKFDFFKALNMRKFWIDINYIDQSITFKGRFRLDSSAEYQIKDVTLKIEYVKLETNTVLINFVNASVDIFPNLCNENVIRIYLPHQEEERIKRNAYFTKFLSNFEVGILATGISDPAINSNKNEDIFDKLREETLLKQKDSGKELSGNKSKALRKSYLSHFESDTSSTYDMGKTIINSAKSINISNTEVTGKTVNSSANSINSSAVNHSVTTAVPEETPVSKKIKKIRNITKHPIRMLRPKRRNLSYGDDEDIDYVPNKKTKNEKKKRRTKLQNKSALNTKTTHDSTEILFDKGKRKIDSVPSSSRIIHVTKHLTSGNECTIGGAGLNNEQGQTTPKAQKFIQNNNKTELQSNRRLRSKSIHPALETQNNYETCDRSLSGEFVNARPQCAISKETSNKCVSEISKDRRQSVKLNSDGLHFHHEQKTQSNRLSRSEKANGEKISKTIRKINIIPNVVKNGADTSQQNLSINSENRPVGAPTKSILKISRSINKRLTIDLTMTEVDNGSNLSQNTFFEDYPQLRLSQCVESGSITVSTPKSLPQTPKSPGIMNTSDIFNDSSFTINFQHDNENGEVSRENVRPNVIQQILNDWQDNDNSNDNNITDIDHIKGQTNNEESLKRQEHALGSKGLKQTIVDRKNLAVGNGLCKYESNKSMMPKKYDGNCSTKNKENSRSTHFAMKRGKKEENAKLMFCTSQKKEETYLNVDNGINSKCDLVSTHTEESIIVLSDDSFDDEEEDKSLAASKPLENVKKLYEKDFFEDNSKIGKCLNDLRHHCLDNTVDLNKQKVYEITENLVSESKEQKKNIQRLILAIDNWRGQMEEQCQIYIKRCIHIESLQVNAEKLLSALKENADIKTYFTNECEELFKHFSGLETNGRSIEIGKTI